MAAQLLLKRGNTASNDAYTGPLGSITLDTQKRKLRVHDGTTAGGHEVANMDDVTNLQTQIDGLVIADIGGLQAALDSLEADKAEKTTTVSAGNGLSGGGDLSANRTITLGTPETVSGSSTNTVSVTGHTHAISVTKADVGLGNVDNTSDADKPVSTAQQTALDGKIDLTEKGAASGVAPLDSNAKIDTVYLSDSVLGQVEYNGTWNASTNTPTLPTTPTAKGDYYVTDTAGSFVVDAEGGGTKTLNFEVGDWIISNGSVWEKVDNTDAVSSVAGKIGVVTLVKGDVGLGNVDNTSDLDKPVSTAQQTEIDTKADLDSPAFTGTPTAPTPLTSDNSTKVATTAYVTAKVDAQTTGVSSVGVTAPITDTGTASDPVIGITNATLTDAGAMSAADKTKLDGIEAGAEANTVDSVAGKTGAVTLVSSDVGLGNVPNYSAAPVGDYTSNNTLMTPQRTVELIEGADYTIDLGTF